MPLSGEILAGGGGLRRHEHLEGVMGYGEILRGARHHFSVYVDREIRPRLEAHPPGPVVVHALHPDEVTALEIAGDPDQVPVPAHLYGVDIEAAVVYAGLRGDDHPPTVEAPVADGDLQET